MLFGRSKFFYAGLLCGLNLLPTKAQTSTDIAILGIKPGMTMDQAREHLAGYTLLGYKVEPGSPIQILGASKNKMDDVLVETVDGKVAVISREIWLPVSGAISLNTYRAQMVTKFGAETPVGNAYGHPPAGELYWQYDAHGNSLKHQQPCGDFKPLQVDAPLQKPGLDDGQPYDVKFLEYLEPRYSPKDYKTNAACFIQVKAVLDRATTDLPLEAINHIKVQIIDPQPLMDLGVRLSTKDALQQQRERKQLEQKAGPPM